MGATNPFLLGWQQPDQFHSLPPEKLREPRFSRNLFAREEKLQGNTSLKDPGCGGTFHLKDCLVSTTTLWLPEVPPPDRLPSLTPVGCSWSDGSGNRWSWPGVWTWGLPGGPRGRGPGASAEGTRNAEALLRPLGGGGGGPPHWVGPSGPDRSQRGTLRPGSVSGQGVCMLGGTGSPLPCTPRLCLRLCCGVRESGVHVTKTTPGQDDPRTGSRGRAGV